MKILKTNKLADGLVEVEFDNGRKAQYRKEELLTDEKDARPEDFRSQVKEHYARDKGTGSDAGAGKEKK